MTLFIILLFACDLTSKKKDTLIEQSNTNVISIKKPVPAITKIPYNLNQIEQTIILHRDLNEISGLSYDNHNQTLIANNDELGVIYTLDLSGKILQRDQFKKKGDFEGIEQIGKMTYIVNSKGDISEYNQQTKETNTFQTALNLTNDIEGLCVHHDFLLLACKGSGTLNVFKKSKKEKAIYKFSLKTKKLEEQAAYRILDEDLEDWVDYNVDETELSKKKFKKLKRRVKQFSPSGIAIHPIDNLIYILSSSGKSLVVIDHKSRIKNVVFLDKDKFVQPEAICFSNKGDLYIGNEAKGLIAKIYKFSMN